MKLSYCTVHLQKASLYYRTSLAHMGRGTSTHIKILRSNGASCACQPFAPQDALPANPKMPLASLCCNVQHLCWHPLATSTLILVVAVLSKLVRLGIKFVDDCSPACDAVRLCANMPTLTEARKSVELASTPTSYSWLSRIATSIRSEAAHTNLKLGRGTPYASHSAVAKSLRIWF